MENTSATLFAKTGNNKGFKTAGFNDCLYEQIVADPKKLDYGSINSDSTIQSHLWNAFQNKSVTIDGTSREGSGTLNVSQTFPLTLAPDEFSLFDTTVVADETVELNGRIIYNSTDTTILTFQDLAATAIFVIKTPWDFSVSNNESYQFLTSINKAYSGNEHRIQLIDNPRMRVNCNYLLMESERRNIENYFQKSMAKKIGVPLFSQNEYLTSPYSAGNNTIDIETKYSIFQKGMIAVISSGTTYETVQIDSVQQGYITLSETLNNNYPENSVITPVLEGYLTSAIDISRLTNDMSRISFPLIADDNRFLHIDQFNHTFEQYKGLPIFDVIFDRRDQTNTFENDFVVIDNNFGPRHIIEKHEEPEYTYNLRYVNFSKEDLYKIKSLINYSKGRLNEFWLPSYTRDIEITKDITSTDTFITIENNNFVHNYSGYEKHIRIQTTQGTFYREIIDYVSLDEKEEQIVIDTNLGVSLNKEDIIIVDFMEKLRSETDEFQLSVLSNNASEINLTMRRTL